MREEIFGFACIVLLLSLTVLLFGINLMMLSVWVLGVTAIVISVAGLWTTYWLYMWSKKL